MGNGVKEGLAQALGFRNQLGLLLGVPQALTIEDEGDLADKGVQQVALVRAERGMIAEAQIRSDLMLDAMTLPVESVVHDPHGASIVFVYFAQQKRVYAKRVETGRMYGREVQIRSGLAGDELVVVAGQERLRDGVTVAAVEAQ